MPDRIEALKELAQRATPGPWQQSHRKKPNGMWDTEVYCAKGGTIAIAGWYPRPEGLGVTGTYRADNAAFIAACDPPTILKLVAVVEKAREQLRLRDDRVHIAATESSAATRTAELMDNGERMEQSWAALRSTLAALDDREPA